MRMMREHAYRRPEGRSSQVNRWWTYQRERFPIFAHGALIFAFSSCAVSLSWLLRGQSGWPSAAAYGVACVTCFLFFLQLRIADEFKDYDEDARFRPYRPVPRGLVALRELRWVFISAALVQLLMAAALAPRMIFLLIIPWLYLAGMGKEFFVRDWLKARPITYLWTHMLIMPLVDLYATGCDWFAARALLPEGLGWFLTASFFNGVVVEVGRKIRAPQDEETGVQTYSVLWGRRTAVILWLSMLVLTGGCAVIVAQRIHFVLPVLALLSALFVTAAGAGLHFCRQPRSGKVFEHLSGLWTLSLYLSLGAVPLILRMWR